MKKFYTNIILLVWLTGVIYIAILGADYTISQYEQKAITVRQEIFYVGCYFAGLSVLSCLSALIAYFLEKLEKK